MKTMVSLVSEQTVPNILGILHFQPASLLFISTEKMEQEGKVSAILDVLEQRFPGAYKLGINAHAIQIQEDSILDCHRKLVEWIEGREDNEFIVNITGGTKLMSIAAFEFFKDYGGRMIYIPLNKNEYSVPFPKKSPRSPMPLKDRLSVMEYLSAYGLKVLTTGEKMERNRQTAQERKELSRTAVVEYEGLSELFSWFGDTLREKRNLKNLNFSAKYDCHSEQEMKFFNAFSFSRNGDYYKKNLSKADIAYLTGGWLEEYCFNIVHDLLGRGVDDVTINISIRNKLGRDNEFDVMFTSENALYFIECKSLEQYHDKGFDILYKIGALQKEFGLRVKSFLVTTSSQIIDSGTGEIKTHIAERAQQFNTKIVTPAKVKDLSSILGAELKKSER